MDKDTATGARTPEGAGRRSRDAAAAGARERAIGIRIAALERDGVLYEAEVVRWARWEYCYYTPLEEVRARAA